MSAPVTRCSGALWWAGPAQKILSYPRLPGPRYRAPIMKAATEEKREPHLPTCRSSRRAGAFGRLLAGLLLVSACQSAGGHRGGGDEPDAAVSDDPRERDFGSGALDMAVGRDAAEAPSDLASDLSAASSDPFDPASCMGPAMSPTEALARIAMAPHIKLADATLMRRTRRCTGTTPDTCGPYGAPVVHEQLLLTYSGGVTTDYKKFSFPTHLILFVQSGQPMVSIRHESDYRHDATRNTRGVLFPFGSDPAENTYPIIYVWDFAPAPYRYDDLQGLLGTKAQLHIGGRCARLRVEDGLGTEIAALYRF